MPKRDDIKSILIIGSGSIVIGQACEFDYSGTQGVTALKEEGYRVILVNPNPATVMTTPGLADQIYMSPLKPEYVEKIIEKEAPDAILSTMGGQTALNLALELDAAGILKKHSVEIIGAGVDSIHRAEDREAFKEVVASLGLESPRSTIVSTLNDAKQVADEIGFPLVIRPSFTLGGMGGSVAESREEFEPLILRAFQESPAGEALVEESLVGWKEFELEVMRDKKDNAIIVCSIENIDPMGVHTGDSITIAPTQTLSDAEYQTMRNAAISILRAIGVDCGGANVQFALSPDHTRMIVIEMNPRVSRSSALASKATGFPIAYCSAKLAVGYTLDEVTNSITGVTASAFEPALDYCAVKVPRFEMEKFPTGYTSLGTQMKSVGESLAMGRTVLEALNKSLQAIENGYEGLQELNVSDEELETILTTAHPLRLLGIFTALKRQGTKAADDLCKKTGYTPWFIYQMTRQVEWETTVEDEGLSSALYHRGKEMGILDSRLAKLSGLPLLELESFKAGSGRGYHPVDTCAGEFDARVSYYYSTWGEEDEGIPLGADTDKVIAIVAGGPNRIGQGLEFDTCCTLASLSLQRQGYRTIMINSNPETVSTDFNISDRLYLEPLHLEYVRDILKKEKVSKVVVQLGGQTSLNMAEELEAEGFEIVGTSLEGIQGAEDRRTFAEAIDNLGLNQPENRSVVTLDEARTEAKAIGYPVLLRPSFVLGGRSMFIAYSEIELEYFFQKGIPISSDRPVLVDQFLEDAFEYDLDGVSDGKNLFVGGIMEHIEAAGVHSGDSACSFPSLMCSSKIQEQMVEAAHSLASHFGIKGLMNIQFAEKNGKLYLIELNPRGSRTVPFISKVSGVNLIDLASRVWLGQDLVQQGVVDPVRRVAIGKPLLPYAIKEAVFSFDRFTGMDPILGPEMKSTGESIGIGKTFGEAFAKAQSSMGIPLPSQGKAFISVCTSDQKSVLSIARDLARMGFSLCGTEGTALFLRQQGLDVDLVRKKHEGDPNITHLLAQGEIQIVINTPAGALSHWDDSYIRYEAVKRKIPFTTTMSAARAAVKGIEHLKSSNIEVYKSESPSFWP